MKKKKNICERCKTQKCEGLECDECNIYCRPFLFKPEEPEEPKEPKEPEEPEEPEAKYAIIPLKNLFN